MKALVTGISGQDAAYLTELLLSKGYEVHGGFRRSASQSYWRLNEMGLANGIESNHPNLKLIPFDLTCSASVTRTIAEGEYDEIYNLAAQSFVAESFNSPASTFDINARGVLYILEAIRQFSGRSKFYQASTSEMFGLVNVESQNESTPFYPRSPYGVAKCAAHYATVNYREAYGLHASCGILFNHESPFRGIEFVTRKVTDGVAKIVAGKQEKLSLGNMEAYRDWGHARDYVFGMWLMLQQEVPDDYVLATGLTYTVEEMVDIAFKCVGLNYKDYIEQDERFMRPSDVPLLCGDPSKAQEKLGWEAVTPFEEMIQEMVNYDLYRQGIDPIELILNKTSTPM